MLYRIFFFLFTLFSVPVVSWALSDTYIYEFVCRDNNCHETKLMPFSDEYHFFFDNITINTVNNFSTHINTQIKNLYTKEYDYNPAGNDNIDDEDYSLVIDKYRATKTGNPTIKKLYFGQLLALGEFWVGDGSQPVHYRDGRDYFLTNFSDIIDTLHTNIGLPSGQKKKSLTFLHPAILEYGYPAGNSTQRMFLMKNVCETNKCTQSIKERIDPHQGSAVITLSGEVADKTLFLERVAHIDSNSFTTFTDFLHAGDLQNFSVEFSDYLTDFSQPYEYKLKYQYIDRPDMPNKETLLHEKFFIKKRMKSDGTPEYRVYQAGIDGVDAGEQFNCLLMPYERSQRYEQQVDDLCFREENTLPIDIQVVNPATNHIRVKIHERFQDIQKTGQVNLFFSIDKPIDASRHVRINDHLLNPTPIRVVHGKYIGGILKVAEVYREEVTKFDDDIFVNPNDTIAIQVSFADRYGNPFTNIRGHRFTLSKARGTSNAIQLIRFGSVTPTNNPLENITDLEVFAFKFLMNTEGWHDLAGFVLTNVDVEEDRMNPGKQFTYIPHYLATKVHVNNGGQPGVTPIKIQAAPREYADIEIKCGRVVEVETECTDDNLSGCNFDPSARYYRRFTSERDNSTALRTHDPLYIIDNAGNIRHWNYTMNHVDRSPPKISLSRQLEGARGGNILPMYATDDMYVDILEQTTAHCMLQDPKTTVRVDLTSTVNGVRTHESTRTLYEGFDGARPRGHNIAFPLEFLQKAGDYEVKITATDKYGNSATTELLRFHVEPNPDEIANDTPLVQVGIGGTFYADGSSCQMYEFILKDRFGNPFKDIPVQRLEHACTVEDSTCNTIFADAVTKTGPRAIELLGVPYTTGEDGKISFCMGSITPGIATPRFLSKLSRWSETGTRLPRTIEYTLPHKEKSTLSNVDFYKPFFGHLSVEGGKIKIGTSMKYSLTLASNIGRTATAFRPTLDEYKDFIQSISPMMSVKNKKMLPSPHDTISLFSGRIDFVIKKDTTKEGLKSMTPAIHIEKNGKSPIVISYIVNGCLNSADHGCQSRYYLSAKDEPEDRTVIDLNEGEVFHGVRIVGSAQGKGEMITTNKDNMGLITLSDQRTTIRRNALSTIKNMDGKKKNRSGDVIGSINKRIKYVEGNYILPDMYGDADKYETVVVKDGNVIIKDDIGTKEKPLGIIVLRDNYDVYRDYKDATGGGNVLVTPNVTDIHAIVYADGAFLSAFEESVGIVKVYERDSADRTAALSLQLNLTGTLFTRNTIGGGMEGEKGNTLPGGKKVSLTDDNPDLAVIYDLNYTRRGNDGCHPKNPDNTCVIPEPFIITHNPIIGTQPPPLFGK